MTRFMVKRATAGAVLMAVVTLMAVLRSAPQAGAPAAPLLQASTTGADDEDESLEAAVRKATRRYRTAAAESHSRQ